MPIVILSLTLRSFCILFGQLISKCLEVDVDHARSGEPECAGLDTFVIFEPVGPSRQASELNCLDALAAFRDLLGLDSADLVAGGCPRRGLRLRSGLRT